MSKENRPKIFFTLEPLEDPPIEPLIEPIGEEGEGVERLEAVKISEEEINAIIELNKQKIKSAVDYTTWQILQGKDRKSKIKELVTKHTDEYISLKTVELDEDMVDMTNELALYLAKIQREETLDAYEQARMKFIKKWSEWKESIWNVEAQIEEEIDEMDDQAIVDFVRALPSNIHTRYDSELGDLYNEVVSLQV